MKHLILLTVFTILSAPVFSQDMWWSKCASLYGPFAGQEPDVVDIYIGDPFYLDDHPEYQIGWNRVLRVATHIMCMGPTDCPVDTSIIHVSPSHGHIHVPDLLKFTLTDLNGNQVATASKIGYDWVDASTYVGNACMDAEIVGWIDPNLPPNDDFNSNSPGMTAGYTDVYTKQIYGNGVVLGWYNGENIQANYTGITSGEYIIVAEGNFDAVLNQGANIYPDGWTAGVIINNFDSPTFFDVVVTPPSEPTNIILDYDWKLAGDIPSLTWDSQANVDYYEIKRWVGKGGNTNAYQELLKEEVLVTTYFDTDIKNAASVLLTGGGAQGKYQIRAANSQGFSGWVDVIFNGKNTFKL